MASDANAQDGEFAQWRSDFPGLPGADSWFCVQRVDRSRVRLGWEQGGSVFHTAPTELVSVEAGFCSTSILNVVPHSAKARFHRDEFEGELFGELPILDN